MDSLAAIEARGLTKRIGKATILRPMDFAVPHGAIVALVGHNGAGKTTLIKLLLNILRPTAGKARVLGIDVNQLRGDAFKHIGYVSEKQAMPEWMTIAQMMEHLRPMYPRWDDKGLLKSLQLPPERKIRHLSRGMRMKAAMASVLAFRPKLLLMDEPFSGLDMAVRAELVQMLLDRAAADETTAVISSHDLEEVETFASHVVFLRAGELLFAEPIETLQARCREVTVTFGGHVAKLAMEKLPAGCVAAEANGAMLRFVDTRVNVRNHEGAVRAMMADAVAVQSEGMNLRAIFLALNKAAQA